MNCVDDFSLSPVRIDSLSFSYGRKPVLEGLSLDFEPGIHGLLGPNGAGKTTLLSLLATERRASKGRISIFGTDVSRLKDARKIRSRIGYCPQQPRLFESFTLAEMVAYVGKLRGVSGRKIQDEVNEAIEIVGLHERRLSRIASLSGGMKQRASLACALVGHPDFLILDEPTVGLDPVQRLDFKEILRDYGDAVILLSTHIVDDVAAVAQHVTVLTQGAVVFRGTTSELTSLGDNENIPGDTPMERAYIRLLGTKR